MITLIQELIPGLGVDDLRALGRDLMTRAMFWAAVNHTTGNRLRDDCLDCADLVLTKALRIEEKCKVYSGHL